MCVCVGVGVCGCVCVGVDVCVCVDVASSLSVCSCCMGFNASIIHACLRILTKCSCIENGQLAMININVVN